MSALPAVDAGTLRSHPAPAQQVTLETVDTSIRTPHRLEIDAVHRLVADHVAVGHLLPRSRADIARALDRFVVAERDGRLVACADLAPLNRRVAEVRSLVVADGERGCGIGRRLVHELEQRAITAGFEMLCAFTHAPSYFVQMGFSIVPHVWLPEKIEADCRSCPQFRRCSQYAVMRPLTAVTTPRLRYTHA